MPAEDRQPAKARIKQPALVSVQGDEFRLGCRCGQGRVDTTPIGLLKNVIHRVKVTGKIEN